MQFLRRITYPADTRKTKQPKRKNADSNLVPIVNEVFEHKNELVLEGWTVCLLLDGIADDGEDWYYRLVEPNEGIVYHSCVGRITYLKGKISDDEYDYIYNMFKMNYPIWKLRKISQIEKKYDTDMNNIKDYYKEVEELFK